jgi:hypothetical protein
MPYGKSYQLTRREFPLPLAYAMTCNKSQSQTLSKVLLNITSPPFNRCQLYIALSHVQDYNNIRLYVTEDQLMQSNISSTGFMPTVDNIVYEDILALNGVNNENHGIILAIDHSLEDLILCYVLLSLKHYCLYNLINIFQVTRAKVIPARYLMQVFKLLQSKNQL